MTRSSSEPASNSSDKKDEDLAPIGAVATLSPTEDVALRRWCFEQAMMLLNSVGNDEPLSMGTAIRKAAGLYGFITKGVKPSE